MVSGKVGRYGSFGGTYHTFLGRSLVSATMYLARCTQYQGSRPCQYSIERIGRQIQQTISGHNNTATDCFLQSHSDPCSPGWNVHAVHGASIGVPSARTLDIDSIEMMHAQDEGVITYGPRGNPFLGANLEHAHVRAEDSPALASDWHRQLKPGGSSTPNDLLPLSIPAITGRSAASVARSACRSSACSREARAAATASS
ncbi:hypothetical protein OBBRIDRAFT_176140 [Obba rivulosa]|uniref:Uncharacterized protein n=1 Tax=Obba rivulosa TaxID=1052685 RepID=A0A8E2DIR8_9APHY|nr:hypothetical protein OBBRIDRAFT_176140 [Obba rivulosa]